MDRLKEFLDYHSENSHNVNFKMIVAMEDREETLKAMHEISELLNTGLTPEQIMELKERDEAMEINEIHVDEYYCPACGTENNCDQGVVEDNFCPRCGRRLKRRED